MNKKKSTLELLVIKFFHKMVIMYIAELGVVSLFGTTNLLLGETKERIYWGRNLRVLQSKGVVGQVLFLERPQIVGYK